MTDRPPGVPAGAKPKPRKMVPFDALPSRRRDTSVLFRIDANEARMLDELCAHFEARRSAVLRAALKQVHAEVFAPMKKEIQSEVIAQAVRAAVEERFDQLRSELIAGARIKSTEKRRRKETK